MEPNMYNSSPVNQQISPAQNTDGTLAYLIKIFALTGLLAARLGFICIDIFAIFAVSPGNEFSDSTALLSSAIMLILDIALLFVLWKTWKLKAQMFIVINFSIFLVRIAIPLVLMKLFLNY